MPRSRVALAAIPLVLLLTATAASGQIPPVPEPLPCVERPGDDRCESWVEVYDHPEEGETFSYQFASDLAVSPDGATAYAAGYRTTDLFETQGQAPSAFALLAVDTATGDRRWVATLDGPLPRTQASAVAVSPDGATVFVTGASRQAFGSAATLVTAAFDAATGADRWTAEHASRSGDAGGRDVVADDETVYVSGFSRKGTPDSRGPLGTVVLAIDATDGTEEWVFHEDGPTSRHQMIDLGLAVHGDRVYVAGTADFGVQQGPGQFNLDMFVLALDARGSDGDRRSWLSYYARGGAAPDRAEAFALDPSGDALVVAGISSNQPGPPPFANDYAFTAVAFDTDDGAQRWESRRQWDGATIAFPRAVAIAGDTVLVSGQVTAPDRTTYGTVAYDLDTGAERWAQRLDTLEGDFELPSGAVASADGTTFYITGMSSNTRTAALFLGLTTVRDQVTVAYDAATGAQRWIARLNVTGYGADNGIGVALGADGRVVTLGEVTRNVEADRNFYDIVLAGYAG